MNTDYENEDDAPMLAAQRKSLDVMSAQLTHNLNLMIAEQEKRVQEFAAQHPQAQMPPVSETPEPVHRSEPQQPLRAKYGIKSPAAPPHVSGKERQVRPERQGRQERYEHREERTQKVQTAPNGRRYDASFLSANAPEKKEKKQISAGNIIFAVVVIIFLLRSCS